jgi:hypothetical protein
MCDFIEYKKLKMCIIHNFKDIISGFSVVKIRDQKNVTISLFQKNVKLLSNILRFWIIWL